MRERARWTHGTEASQNLAAPPGFGYRNDGDDGARRRRSAADTGIGNRGCNRRKGEGQSEEELTGNLVDKEMWSEEQRRGRNHDRRRRLSFGAPDAFHGSRSSQHKHQAPTRRGRRGEEEGQGLQPWSSTVCRRFEKGVGGSTARVRVSRSLVPGRGRGREQGKREGGVSEMGTPPQVLSSSESGKQEVARRRSTRCLSFCPEEEEKGRKELF